MLPVAATLRASLNGILPVSTLGEVNLETIFEELKTLPPQRLERAADYIHRLHSDSRLDRKAALRRAAGSLTNEEADELAQIVEQGCERVDESEW